MIKLVNYIRSEANKGNREPDVTSIGRFSDDCYLKPILENDAVLFSLGDLDIGELDNPQTTDPQGSAPQEDDAQEDTMTLKKRITQLEDALSTVSLEFSTYRNTVLQTLGGSLSEDDLALNPEAPKTSAKGDEMADMANGIDKPNGDAATNSNEKAKGNTSDSKKKGDDDYFDAYSYNGRIPCGYPHFR
jgi:hypothetical protein